MDEMKITTKFTRGLLAKIVQSAVRKKAGCDVYIQLNELNAAVAEGKAKVHLSLDAELDQAELGKLLKTVGLG